MGAETSKSKKSGASGSSKRSGLSILPGRSKSSLIAKWQKRQLSTQLFSIVRHAERADGIYAFVDGTRWHITEDFRRWPLDPPLSDAGLEQAQEMGHYLEQYAGENDSTMHVVISSPYCRCIQTAVLICNSLGPGARLLVDRSLGEVYGPSVMGATEPCSPVRSMEEALAYCSIHGVTCHSRIIGTWPTWPEQLKDARRRYCLRFFSYLQRSETTRRNFILVAHGDCVGAVLSTMPSLMHQVVEKVDYGGLFVAKRKRTESKKEKSRKGAGSMTAILPATAEEAGEVPEEAADFDLAAEVENIKDLRPRALHGNWMEDTDMQEQAMTTPKASDAWEVELNGITMRQREGAAKFQRRLRALAAQSELSSRKIERLLGELADEPLGDDAATQSTVPVRTLTERSGVVPSCYSVSTYLFGTSEAGGERELSTHEFDMLDDQLESAGTSNSLGGATMNSLGGVTAGSDPDSPREARPPRRCITPQQLRALTPGTPRRSGRNGSPPASAAFAHRKTNVRTLSSASAEMPQRAATLHSIMGRNMPARTPSLRDMEQITSSGSDAARRSATTLLPVFESQQTESARPTDCSNAPEPAKPEQRPTDGSSAGELAQPRQSPTGGTSGGGGGLSGMQNSALMRRRRSSQTSEPQPASTPQTSPSADGNGGNRLRLLPNEQRPSDEAGVVLQLIATRAVTPPVVTLEPGTPTTPTTPLSPTTAVSGRSRRSQRSPTPPSPPSPARPVLAPAAPPAMLAPALEVPAPGADRAELEVPAAAPPPAAQAPGQAGRSGKTFGGLDGSALFMRRRGKRPGA